MAAERGKRHGDRRDRAARRATSSTPGSGGGDRLRRPDRRGPGRPMPRRLRASHRRPPRTPRPAAIAAIVPTVCINRGRASIVRPSRAANTSTPIACRTAAAAAVRRSIMSSSWVGSWWNSASRLAPTSPASHTAYSTVQWPQSRLRLNSAGVYCASWISRSTPLAQPDTVSAIARIRRRLLVVADVGDARAVVRRRGSRRSRRRAGPAPTPRCSRRPEPRRRARGRRSCPGTRRGRSGTAAGRSCRGAPRRHSGRRPGPGRTRRARLLVAGAAA